MGHLGSLIALYEKLILQMNIKRSSDFEFGRILWHLKDHTCDWNVSATVLPPVFEIYSKKFYFSHEIYDVEENDCDFIFMIRVYVKKAWLCRGIWGF